MAYGVCEKGSDWTTIKFKRASGEDLDDIVPNVKFSHIDWLANEGIFYSVSGRELLFPFRKMAQNTLLKNHGRNNCNSLQSNNALTAADYHVGPSKKQGQRKIFDEKNSFEKQHQSKVPLSRNENSTFNS